MKIEKLILKNFSAVKNAMNANEITIDFSQARNNICLIIGPNGSGKTTILSMLHPFSDVGNLDVRNANQLILNKKDGYKEIVIRKKNDLYTIKHFYTYHKTKDREYHGVKSYIYKNEEDLNPNGNVSSFKEIIKNELQIESDYLKLIRLESNVTSLIDLSSTERKNFMSKIMDDIGIYLKYYKAINNKLRQLDNMIGHDVDKIKRLKISDKVQYEDSIESLKKSIEQEQALYISLNNEAAVLKEKYHNIEDVDNLSIHIKETKAKLKKMEKILEKKSEMVSTDPSYYEEKIQSAHEKMIKNKADYESNNTIIKTNLSLLDSMTNQYHSLMVQKTKSEETDKELRRMEDNLTKIRKEMRVSEDILGDFKPNISKEELSEFMRFLTTQSHYAYETYEFGESVITKVIDLMERGKNINHYINSHLLELSGESGNQDTIFMHYITTKFHIQDKKIECEKTCPAKDFYYQIQTLINNSIDKDTLKTKDFYTNMSYVYDNIQRILNAFKDYKDIIERLPEYHKNFFKLDAFYDHFSHCQPIYDEEKMKDFLSLTTEYDHYNQLKKDYDKENSLKQTFSSLTYAIDVDDELSIVKKNINDTQVTLSDLRDTNKLLKEENEALDRDIEINTDIKETLESYGDTKNLYQKYLDDNTLKNDINESLKTNALHSQDSASMLALYRNELQTKLSNLQQYEAIEKEMETMNMAYDDLVLIKKSLSSKEGMPLRIIGRYLDNTETITNELLDIAYDGKIYIDKFNITANEFSIPFYNNGVRLDDVKFASQGELSFLSIALSFALSSQVLSKYNIMLLDEIDGPLDTRNREKFIKILENQIERIHSEQNFLITHNDMFSSYPVDILDLSFKNDTEEYSLANFIQIERK